MEISVVSFVFGSVRSVFVLFSRKKAENVSMKEKLKSLALKCYKNWSTIDPLGNWHYTRWQALITLSLGKVVKGVHAWCTLRVTRVIFLDFQDRKKNRALEI